MRINVAICLLVAVVVVAVDVASANSASEWRQFKRQFGKSYATRAEEVRRFANFLARREKILRHNAGRQTSHKLGLNHMADWSEEEFARVNGLKYDRQAIESVRLASPSHVTTLLGLDNDDDDDASLPAEVDWRKVAGRVTPVKDQGPDCGSCWAFATTGLLEGQEMARNVSGGANGAIKSLSEQELVDCSKSNSGCDGGVMSLALADIKSLGGVETNKDYPYKAHTGQCKFKRSKVVIEDEGSAILPEGDEETLKRTVAKYGPVAVAIMATFELQDYQSGVFEDKSCSPDGLNHGVLIVGYGTDPEGGDYWIVKNSWSAKWGENGYVRFKRGTNMCGIAQMATVAKF